jgi:UDPglucose--hexose-1-phosphate uridylyltransferase
MDINFYICQIIDYGVKTGLIKNDDRIWAANRIISHLKISSFNPPDKYPKNPLPKYPGQILSKISLWASENKIIKNIPFEREIFETSIIAIFLQRPSDFAASFYSIAKKKNIKAATQWLYEKQRQSYYIKAEQIEKNIIWKTKTKYGDFDITINLSKPEKTPQEIAAIKLLGSKALEEFIYPKCILCPQNEGYEGRLNHPPRQNVRLIPLKLNNEKWYFQYSPYVYYNEHCILLSASHTDMKIDKKTFVRFADFLRQFPHYFIGSNADLPIVGGSILNHEHYQGGNFTFALHKAKTLKTFTIKKFPNVKFSILFWAMSVIRITGKSKDVVLAADYIFNKWKNYSDPKADIKARGEKIRHNTITPIAKMLNKKMQIDLVLRNNAVSEKFPEGIFHTNPCFYHIKRENMGIIEALGMAILPGRLKEAAKKIANYLSEGKVELIKQDKEISSHYLWAKEIYSKYKIDAGNIENILRKEIGLAFASALECCKVFKDDSDGAAAFDRFIKNLNGIYKKIK